MVAFFSVWMLFCCTLLFYGYNDSPTLNVANEPESSVTMVVVLVAPGALLIAIIGLAAILAVFHGRRKTNLRQHPQSAGQACDTDEANEDSNYAKTANGKPDVIKSKRGNIRQEQFCAKYKSRESEAKFFKSLFQHPK